MPMIESAFEEAESHDPLPERAIALHAASLVGISASVVRSLRGADVIRSGLSAREWLRVALDADKAVSARSFGDGLWSRLYEEALG